MLSDCFCGSNVSNAERIAVAAAKFYLERLFRDPTNIACLEYMSSLEDDDALQLRGLGQILVRAQLRPLARAQQHRRRVRLEACVTAHVR